MFLNEPNFLSCFHILLFVSCAYGDTSVVFPPQANAVLSNSIEYIDIINSTYVEAFNSKTDFIDQTVIYFETFFKETEMTVNLYKESIIEKIQKMKNILAGLKSNVSDACRMSNQHELLKNEII